MLIILLHYVSVIFSCSNKTQFGIRYQLSMGNVKEKLNPKYYSFEICQLKSDVAKTNNANP